MKKYRKRHIWIGVLLMLAMLSPGSVFGQRDTPPSALGTAPRAEYKAGDVIVKLDSKISRSSVTQIRQRYNATWQQNLYNSDVQVWTVPEGREIETVAALNADPAVIYAELNYRYYAFETIPNDPDFGKLWGLSAIKAPQAWDYTTGDSSVIIAIIDSGIDLNHPDLKDKLVQGRDFVPVVQDDIPQDENGHGTHVAGIAAAASNNGIGIAGTSWGAKIMPVRVLDENGEGWTIDSVNGIRWAYQNGAKVINLSFGGSTYSQSMQDVIQEAYSAGSLIIAAMGNCRYKGSSCPVENPTNYPAALNNVIAVAATTRSNYYTSYSQYGTHCDIAAPGGDMSFYGDPNGIYSTLPTYDVHLTTDYAYLKNYDHMQGTSQATPYVSGVTALLWSIAPELTSNELWATLRTTAVDLGDPGKDEDYGYGLVDAYAAVQKFAAPLAPTLNPIDNADQDGDYTVTWEAPELAEQYTLEESADANFDTPITRYTGSDTQVIIDDQPAGQWFYRVRTSNAQGDSPWSNVQTVDIVPQAPTLTILPLGERDAYQLTWSSVEGAQGYRVQEDLSAQFDIRPIFRYVGSATTYTVTGQAEGTWYYRVQAYNEIGEGAWSTTQVTQVAASPLMMPVWTGKTTLYLQYEKFYLTWSSVTSATTYILEESLSPYFIAPTEVYTGLNTVFAGINYPQGRWYYRVRAHSSEGNSPWSETKTVDVVGYVYLPLIQKEAY